LKSDYWFYHACLSVRMEQLVSHGTDFHEIRYLGFFRGSMSRKLEVSLQCDKNNGTLHEDLSKLMIM
jgi:hypothetical protein